MLRVVQSLLMTEQNEILILLDYMAENSLIDTSFLLNNLVGFLSVDSQLDFLIDNFTDLMFSVHCTHFSVMTLDCGLLQLFEVTDAEQIDSDC